MTHAIVDGPHLLWTSLSMQALQRVRKFTSKLPCLRSSSVALHGYPLCTLPRTELGKTFMFVRWAIEALPKNIHAKFQSHEVHTLCSIPPLRETTDSPVSVLKHPLVLCYTLPLCPSDSLQLRRYRRRRSCKAHSDFFHSLRNLARQTLCLKLANAQSDFQGTTKQKRWGRNDCCVLQRLHLKSIYIYIYYIYIYRLQYMMSAKCLCTCGATLNLTIPNAGPLLHHLLYIFWLAQKSRTEMTKPSFLDMQSL